MRSATCWQQGATTCYWRRDFGCLQSTCCNSTTVMKFSDSNPRTTGQVHIRVPRCTPHRHNLKDRLATLYLQSSGLNKVYHSDLTHDVSQLVCEKSSFWGEIWHHHRGKARRHGGAEFDAKECGHRLSSKQINLKYA
jgi:hypothetical protein